jgi:hypothetical protein
MISFTSLHKRLKSKVGWAGLGWAALGWIIMMQIN